VYGKRNESDKTNGRRCVGLIPQPRSPTKCLWIEKSIKEGQGPIRTVEANGKKLKKNKRRDRIQVNLSFGIIIIIILFSVKSELQRSGSS
jgi:hypothetical protein